MDWIPGKINELCQLIPFRDFPLGLHPLLTPSPIWIIGFRCWMITHPVHPEIKISIRNYFLSCPQINVQFDMEGTFNITLKSISFSILRELTSMGFRERFESCWVLKFRNSGCSFFRRKGVWSPFILTNRLAGVISLLLLLFGMIYASSDYGGCQVERWIRHRVIFKTYLSLRWLLFCEIIWTERKEWVIPMVFLGVRALENAGTNSYTLQQNTL